MARYSRINPDTGSIGRANYRGDIGSVSGNMDVHVERLNKMTEVSFTIWDSHQPIRITLSSAELDRLVDFRRRVEETAAGDPRAAFIAAKKMEPR